MVNSVGFDYLCAPHMISGDLFLDRILRGSQRASNDLVGREGDVKHICTQHPVHTIHRTAKTGVAPNIYAYRFI